MKNKCQDQKGRTLGALCKCPNSRAPARTSSTGAGGGGSAVDLRSTSLWARDRLQIDRLIVTTYITYFNCVVKFKLFMDTPRSPLVGSYKARASASLPNSSTERVSARRPRSMPVLSITLSMVSFEISSCLREFRSVFLR